MSCDAKVIATGDLWVGYGIRSFQSELIETMMNARESILISAYTITEKSIIHSMEKVLKKGVSVTLYLYASETSNYHQFSDVLNQMERKYGNFWINKVKNTVLHAKVLVSDNTDVIIGSANPTQSGMYLNYELGLHLRSEEIARNIIMLLERLPYE